MKKTLFTIIALLSFVSGMQAQEYAKFDEGLIKDIHPKGWLKEFLERQVTGLSGHPEALSYPYNTCLWAGYIPRIKGQFDSEWWRYEQTAYYTDGILRLGYNLGNEALINKGEEGIKYTLDNRQPNGRLGDSRLESLWPIVVFARAMQAEYEYRGDNSIVDALEKHYLTFSHNDLVNGHRHILNIEGLLWTYGKTGNKVLLHMAEDAYDAGGFPLDTEEAGNDKYIHMHGVTYSEQLKLPMMLYAYTGNEKYLRLAMNAERKLERDHMLPDGLFSSAEYTLGNDIDIAHETCNVTDYTWTLGYFLTTTGEAEWADRIERVIFNAAPGSVTKDFKALQYFSSVNQVIATGTSDDNEFKRGSTWMAYRPTHETECCAGNVSRFMPNFTARLWMRGRKGEVVAAMYSPSEFAFEKDGAHCQIVEDTYYPFDGEINFRFKTDKAIDVPFMFRIPGWCENCEVLVNGKKMEGEYLSGCFATLHRTFSDGDVVTLRLAMQPRIVEAKNNQGRYVECGPLLYSYAIPEKFTEDNEVYANMNGKHPENPDFKCWSVTPTGAWNYAMLDTKSPLKLKVDKKKLRNGYPFDKGNQPVSITIPAQQIEWTLTDGKRNPALPEKVVPLKATRQLQLVPYGSTHLRLTVFPVIK